MESTTSAFDPYFHVLSPTPNRVTWIQLPTHPILQNSGCRDSHILTDYLQIPDPLTARFLTDQPACKAHAPGGLLTAVLQYGKRLRQFARSMDGMRATAKNSKVSKTAGLNTSALEIFKVLTSFVSREGTCGVTELANELGLTKNQAFRTLSTLVDEGYLVRDASGTRYELGYRVLDFRNLDVPKNDIRSLCTEYLRRMQELTGESVMLALPVGLRVVTVDGVESFGRRYSRIAWGFAPPLHAGAAARAILASLTDSEISKYLEIASPLRKFTENTIVTTEKLWEEVGKVRARGYAIGLQDLTFGSNYVSFAILDINKRPHGALTVGGPIDRFSPTLVDRTIDQMKTIVAELNQKSQLVVAAPFFISS